MMAYLNRFFLLSVASSALALSACDKGSLGEYGETDGESESESDTASTTGTSTSGTDSNSGGSDTASTSGTATGNPTTTTGETDGVVGECDYAPNHMCEMAFDCDSEVECGGVGHFDANGCARPSCNSHDDCGDGELCLDTDNFQTEGYDYCIGSAFSCYFEPEEGCVCGGTADCNGSVCLPSSDYPLAHTTFEQGPSGSARHDNGCAPNDAVAEDFYVGLSDAQCDTELNGALRFQLLPPLVEFRTYNFNDTLTMGWYDLDGNGTFDQGESVTDGFVEITGVQGDNVSGDYELVVGDTLYIGSFDMAPGCTVDIVCG